MNLIWDWPFKMMLLLTGKHQFFDMNQWNQQCYIGKGTLQERKVYDVWESTPSINIIFFSFAKTNNIFCGDLFLRLVGERIFRRDLFSRDKKYFSRGLSSAVRTKKYFSRNLFSLIFRKRLKCCKNFSP